VFLFHVKQEAADAVEKVLPPRGRDLAAVAEGRTSAGAWLVEILGQAPHADDPWNARLLRAPHQFEVAAKEWAGIVSLGDPWCEFQFIAVPGAAQVLERVVDDG